jgi:hypothetical protein
MSDVLVLADGTKIDKKTGGVVGDEKPTPELLAETEVEDEVDEDEIVAIKQRIPVNRFLSDLPGDINSSRAIAVIAGLTLFGLNDREISIVCDTDMEKITTIKQSERFQDFTTGIIDNVMRAQSDNIRAMFITHSKEAANTIVSGLKSKDFGVRYGTSKEILDRAGFRPADVVEHRVKHENELKIVHIRGDVEKHVTIDTDYDEAL